MAKRIYLVTNLNDRYLVEASTNAQAVAYISHRTVQARVPSQHELIELVNQNVKVEIAKPENLKLIFEGEK